MANTSPQNNLWNNLKTWIQLCTLSYPFATSKILYTQSLYILLPSIRSYQQVTLGIKHTGVFWKIDFQCCPTDQFLVFYILFCSPRLIKMRVCVYVLISCVSIYTFVL